jgi:hypothetical protein
MQKFSALNFHRPSNQWPLSKKAAATVDMFSSLPVTQSGRGTKKDGAVRQGVVNSQNGNYGTTTGKRFLIPP